MFPQVVAFIQLLLGLGSGLPLISYLPYAQGEEVSKTTVLMMMFIALACCSMNIGLVAALQQ